MKTETKELDKANLVQREIELRDGTRKVETWITGDEARVRVELR